MTPTFENFPEILEKAGFPNTVMRHAADYLDLTKPNMAALNYTAAVRTCGGAASTLPESHHNLQVKTNSSENRPNPHGNLFSCHVAGAIMCWRERRLKLMLSQPWSRFLVARHSTIPQIFIDRNEIDQVWANSSKHSARALMAAYLWERSRALVLLELIKIGRTVLWRFTFLSHSLKFQHDGCFPKDMSTNQSCWFWNRRKARRRCKFIVKNLSLSPPLIP